MNHHSYKKDSTGITILWNVCPVPRLHSTTYSQTVGTARWGGGREQGYGMFALFPGSTPQLTHRQLAQQVTKDGGGGREQGYGMFAEYFNLY